jgi:CRISPR/Cas system-associated endonuclease Cas3-HD
MTKTQEELSDSMVVALKKLVADIWTVMKEDLTNTRENMPLEPLLAEWNKLLMKSKKIWWQKWEVKKQMLTMFSKTTFMNAERDSLLGDAMPNASIKTPDRSKISWTLSKIATAQRPLQSPETQEFSCNESRVPYQVLW